MDRPGTIEGRDGRVRVAAGADVLGGVRPYPGAGAAAGAGQRERASATADVVAMLAILGILLLAASIRVWQLGAIGFNTDEAVYVGQAAAITGDPDLKPYFPLFRAHPLLFQFILAMAFTLAGDVSDVVGRLVGVGVGVLTVALVYALGRLLYDVRVGLVAALLLAVMPYHVVVTRQVLLDGPMVLFATLALYTVARYCVTGRAAWLYAAGAAMGLTFMAKETSIILFGAIYALFALAPSIPVRFRDLVLAMAAFGATVLAVPLALLLAGGGANTTTEQYLVWQLFRRPNHEADFYLVTVPPAVGPLVIVAAVAALWFMRRRLDWRVRLLLAWMAVVVVFFQLWPVKGFQYLLPAAPPLAVLAAVGLVSLAGGSPSWLGPARPGPRSSALRRVAAATLALVLTLGVTTTLAAESWSRIQPSESAQFLAGSGGISGGREAGIWIREHTPEGSRLMTIGPSMANVLAFYGHRSVQGLSVSPNPLRRNPSYDPVLNPDHQIRSNELQYVVWDSYSANRSPFFAVKLLDYVDRYHGREVHRHSITDPARGLVPVIVVYEVRR